MSKRSELAQELADKVNELDLNNPFGGEVSLQTSGKGFKYYEISFSHPRTLDGVIRIFSEKKIIIHTNRDDWEFDNKEDALKQLEKY